MERKEMKKIRYNKQGWGVLPRKPSNTHTGQTTRKSRIGHGWVTHYHYIPFGQRSGENGYPTTLIGKL